MTVVPGSKSHQPVVARLVDLPRFRIVGHGDGRGLVIVQAAVVVQVRVNHHAGQARFVRIAAMVPVAILVLLAVNFAAAATIAEINAFDDVVRTDLDDMVVDLALARRSLHVAVRHDLADHVRADGQIQQPVMARLVDVLGVRVVRHGDGRRFLDIQLAVVVQIHVHRDTGQSRFAFVPDTVAVLVQPLGAVDFAPRLVAKIQAGDRLAGT